MPVKALGFRAILDLSLVYILWWVVLLGLLSVSLTCFWIVWVGFRFTMGFEFVFYWCCRGF